MTDHSAAALPLPAAVPPMRRKWWIALVVLAMGLAVAGAHRAALFWNLRQLEEHSVNRLDLIATTIEATLARFRYLPDVVARSREIEALFAYGRSADTIDTANTFLDRIATASKSNTLFVIGRDGTTIAASNYRMPTSFVGQNYAFRSYFTDAIRNKSGRLYAIGATTGEPGYFLSTPIVIGRETVGVAVVKIDLLPLEQDWSDAREDVGVRDDDGIIFLASDPRWRYRSVRGLAREEEARISEGKRYGQLDLEGSPLFVPAQPSGGPAPAIVSQVDGTPERGLLMERRINENDWTLIYLASLTEAERHAGLVGLAAGLASLLLISLWQIWRQRRKAHRLERESRVRLEARVADRTLELTRANSRLTKEVSERRRTERELEITRNDLLQAAKLATIGQAFASMAHEVNQPLTALRAYLASSQLLSDRGDRDGLSSNIVLMRGVVDRLADLTGRLKSLARPTQAETKAVDLLSSIQRITDLMTFRIDAMAITVEVHCQNRVLVLADPGRLDQIALNLITNAIDAVEKRPIRTISIHVGHHGNWAVLSVEDSGEGLAQAVRDRLFEPFVTTKRDTGLGLGLATVKTIVTEYNGTIASEPSDLGGARFTIRLPLAGIGPSGT
jgi:two-component system C4-dicarboxylate transport sensor histidine kinase DctB